MADKKFSFTPQTITDMQVAMLKSTAKAMAQKEKYEIEEARLKAEKAKVELETALLVKEATERATLKVEMPSDIAN